jgi:hypothetical protein
MNFREVNSFEIAAQRRNIDPTLPDLSLIPERFRKPLLAAYMLFVVFEAVNIPDEGGEPWQPNWNDEDEPKYNPWFEIEATEEKTSGLGFSDTDCDFWHTVTFVGSRLCTFSSERSDFIAQTFNELYKDLFLIP